MARAEREQRPLFLHFVGHDCQPAVQMANEVFVQPNVIAHLNANFVMVRINASENAVLAQKFDVKSIPTDLILKPNGMLIYRRTGGISAERFSEFLTFLQGKIQSDNGPAFHTSLPVANPPGFPNPATPAPVVAQPLAFPETIRDSFVQQPPQTLAAVTAPPASANPLRTAETATKPTADSFTLNPPRMPVNPVQVQPVPSLPPVTPTMPVIVANEPAPAKMTVEVPLALEGFCPVTLCAEERWVSGNPAFCTMYLGHIFRFATSEALGTFAKNPANYIPVAMGEDIVLMVERNKRINGNRKFGAWYEGRVFLFSSQETLDAFANRPEYYTEIALKYELAQKERPTVY
jgi:YHS domain-containing protein